MQTSKNLAASVFAATVCALIQPALADPCGMVPPIYPGQQIPLARVGLQQTYVFFENGVETFVIRPGFTGKVDQFGMLIPFPSPPAIRKVPDHIFQHIAAAVDPPEVVVDLRIRFSKFARDFSRKSEIKEQFDDGLKYEDQVKVLRQEAVGMYEVAVLEAGSAAALKHWMDEHGYKYPDGMDAACDDYVESGWCFVAVKTKVGTKGGVDPKPGQRSVTSKLPKGSAFDGHVQGMGFRFKVDELVVPMRLSAFNKGELRNIVYLLTDGPRKIRAIPEEYVVRQIAGEQLYKNLTQPLPLRIIGGTEVDIPDYRRKSLVQERNPIPKNGAAAELFASDLLAASTGELALAHEEREKELLRIGERFGLRGPAIDKLNGDALSEGRRKTVEQALDKIRKMTLTVVDGDFPRELLGRQNLTFAEYKMPARRNKSESYDATLNGPAPKKQGILKVGSLLPIQHEQIAKTNSHQRSIWVALALVVVGIGLTISWRMKARGILPACIVFMLFAMLFGSIARGETKAGVSYYEKTLHERNIETDADGLNAYLGSLHPSNEQKKLAAELIEQLGHSDSFAKREAAMSRLLVMPQLPNEALIAATNGPDPEIRWRAKQILRLGKPESDRVRFAVFKTIEEKKLAGVTNELLRAIPLCDKPHLRFAARQALRAAARPGDATALRNALTSENVDVRIAAAAALGAAINEKAVTDLNKLLDDSEDEVKLAAARALADFGNRKSLSALLELLSSNDRRVRTSSALALRQLSGKRFGFAAYDVSAKRKAAIEKWETWIADSGETAKLNYPLNPLGTGSSYLGGNTLLAYSNLHKVVEIDPSGKEVWSYTTAQNVWSAEKLANGNVLMAVYGKQQVVEADRNGNVVWQYASKSPLNAKQLLNGNILIGEWSGKRAVEVDREKNVVWEYTTPGSCGDIHRLDNGNTLVAVYQHGVFEVTPDKKKVWEYGAKQCYGCQPLPDGNVLIAELGGRVIEVNRNKEVVWEIAEPGAVDAFRLPNGNTLITGSTRFVELTPDKKVVWSKTGTQYGSARR